MIMVTTVGLDIAKQVFQAHGADKVGKAVLRRKLRRGEVAKFFARLSPCWVGIEASAALIIGRESLKHSVTRCG